MTRPPLVAASTWVRRVGAAVLVAVAAGVTAPAVAAATPTPGPGWEITAGGVIKVDTGIKGGNVAGTVTAVTPRGAGHLTMWPCDTTKPATSVLNYQPGRTIANTAIAKVAADGTLCFYSSEYTHLLWDQAGTLPAANSALRAPTRLLDTRNGAGPRPAGSTTVINVGAATAAATVGTLTVVAPDSGGHATVWPCHTPKPVASTINFTAGVTVANSTIVPASPAGQICVYTSSRTHLLWDTAGELRPTSVTFGGTVGTSPRLATPTRLLDTRSGDPADAGGVTAVYAGNASSAAIGTLTVVAPDSGGHATVWPCGAPKPVASTINFTAGVTVANSTIAPTSSSGWLCIYTSSRTHLLWDNTGDMRGIGMFGAPQRKLDTRTLDMPQHPRAGGSFYPNVTRWRDTVWQQMQPLNVDRKYLPGILAQIQQESSGIPTAVNNWDSNWAAGYASFGLMQTIYPTFNTYTHPVCKKPSTGLLVNGRWQQYTPAMVDPACSVYAGVNYVKNRYGQRLFDTWNTGRNLAY